MMAQPADLPRSERGSGQREPIGYRADFALERERLAWWMSHAVLGYEITIGHDTLSDPLSLDLSEKVLGGGGGVRPGR
jgi:hypothetical protein